MYTPFLACILFIRVSLKDPSPKGPIQTFSPTLIQPCNINPETTTPTPGTLNLSSM
ncbi:MAG: hypothetical protein QXG70_02365 [Candidatus Methanomethylicaceae archaeon]